MKLCLILVAATVAEPAPFLAHAAAVAIAGARSANVAGATESDALAVDALVRAAVGVEYAVADFAVVVLLVGAQLTVAIGAAGQNVVGGIADADLRLTGRQSRMPAFAVGVDAARILERTDHQRTWCSGVVFDAVTETEIAEADTGARRRAIGAARLADVAVGTHSRTDARIVVGDADTLLRATFGVDVTQRRLHVPVERDRREAAVAERPNAEQLRRIRVMAGLLGARAVDVVHTREAPW